MTDELRPAATRHGCLSAIATPNKLGREVVPSLSEFIGADAEPTLTSWV